MLAITINASFASSVVISLHMFIIFGEFMTFCVSLYQFLCVQTVLGLFLTYNGYLDSE